MRFFIGAGSHCASFLAVGMPSSHRMVFSSSLLLSYAGSAYRYGAIAAARALFILPATTIAFVPLSIIGVHCAVIPGSTVAGLNAAVIA